MMSDEERERYIRKARIKSTLTLLAVLVLGLLVLYGEYRTAIQ